MAEIINLEEWYNPTEAAERLTANSGKPIDISYVRTLARYGKITTYQISPRVRLYLKKDVDAYIVEERGKKSGRAKRQKAKRKTQREQTRKSGYHSADRWSRANGRNPSIRHGRTRECASGRSRRSTSKRRPQTASLSPRCSAIRKLFFFRTDSTGSGSLVGIDGGSRAMSVVWLCKQGESKRTIRGDCAASPRKSRPVRNVTRWMEQGTAWVLVQKKE